MTDVVVVSLEAWDGVWRRNQHLVAALMRADSELRVLFVEPAVDPLHAMTRRSHVRKGRGLRRGPAVPGVRREQLWLLEPTKWLPRRLRPDIDDRLATATVKAARRLGLEDPLLWVNDPMGAEVLRLSHWSSLYDITDDWLAADRPAAEHRRTKEWEAYLLEHCEEVVVCSERLRASKHRARLSVIRNAVDTEAYRRRHPRPDDLPIGPVAVYVGTIHTDRIDVDLCLRTARGMANRGTLVLVGPDLLAPAESRALAQSGVLLLGAKEHDDVPAYLQNADILVVPHKVSAFTDSLDPIKVYEYRAAARPVVSTPVAGFRDAESASVTVADPQKFVAAVVAALASSHRPFDLVPRGDVPDWTTRAAEMEAVLHRVRRV